MQGNHSLVTHMLVRDVVNLSTVRQSSVRFSMCTNKKYNSRNKVGPITNKKTGNSLMLRGTLPNLVTRFEDIPDNSMLSPRDVFSYANTFSKCPTHPT